MKFKFTALFALSFSAFSSFAQVSAPSIETSFQTYLNDLKTNGPLYDGNGLPTFLIKENTKGNRYLFDKWVKGSVLGTNGVVYSGSNMLLNYDKIAKKLFLKADSTIIQLSSGDIAGFTLIDQDSIHFERLKNSTDLNFYQPVYKNEKGYSLYKLLETKFKKADYQTNGIIESGNKYDEYVDTEDFFIVTPKQELLKIIFKKKVIGKVLENESSKVDAFFSQHKGEAVDQNFVKQLLEYLNTAKS